MIERVALGERARELVLGDRAALEQHLLGRLAGVARRLDRLLGLLLAHEPELDEDVGQEAPARAAQARRGHARARQRRTAAGARDLAHQRVGAHASPFAGAVPSGVPLRRAGPDCAEISASSSAWLRRVRVGEPLDAVGELDGRGAVRGRTLERALEAAEEGERAVGALAAHQHGAEAVG